LDTIKAAAAAIEGAEKKRKGSPGGKSMISTILYKF